MKKIIAIFVTFLLIIVPTKVIAASVSTSITGPTSVKQGDTITLSYYLSAYGDFFDNGKANIQYNSADLEFISFVPASTHRLTITRSGMQINIVNMDVSEALNNVLVGTIKFKVLAEPGKTVSVKLANLNFTYRAIPINEQPIAGSWAVTVYTPPVQIPTPNINVSTEPVQIPTYNINVSTDGNGKANANVNNAKAGEVISLTVTANTGYKFKGWQVVSGEVTIDSDNKFTMPARNVSIKAIFEEIPKGEKPSSPLESINIDGFDLFPRFDSNDPELTDYVLVLPEDVTKIDIDTLPVDEDSTVEITGADDLRKGTNIIQITVTDKNGKQKIYTIAAIVGDNDANTIDGKGFFCDWWWLLLLAIALGFISGYSIDKFILNKNKKKVKKNKKS